MARLASSMKMIFIINFSYRAREGRDGFLSVVKSGVFGPAQIGGAWPLVRRATRLAPVRSARVGVWLLA